MINKIDAARRQIECAVRLVVNQDDELAVHTLTMAAYTILMDLAKGTPFYEFGMKPYLTTIGTERFRGASAFLKHADRDPTGILPAFDSTENDWRIGFGILLYRELKGAFTPAMAAFHCWMVIRHPDEFALAEDSDPEFEQLYRQAIELQKKSGREVEVVFLKALLDLYKQAAMSATTGFLRRSPGPPCH
ncbi:MAG: hypothetical protein ABSA66_20100 [Roseiarcus sp.]|jgi:hypothetical protein